MEKEVIVISGPTASGKTKLAIELAKLLDTEIISADSRQIFRYLDIGTAKPSTEELSAVKHHFIDIRDPDEEYNVSIFEKEAGEVIAALHSSGKIPVVAGGSGLYIKALIDGIFEGPARNEELREELRKFKEEKGNERLYEILQEKDPVSAAKMTPGHWKRVIRALEVLETTGEPIWKHHIEQTRSEELIWHQFFIDGDRGELYRTIEERVDKMIENGLETETRNILKMGYEPSLNSLNTVGYKEMISYICGSISLDRSIELIKQNTRRYAKRQLTWIRGDKRFIPLRRGENLSPEFIVNSVLNRKTDK
ncbi:MAG: tRNA dimethylallyltransferase [Ignavibacteriaceae bacterium]|nr:MAG: tRNA dimethylallyltransferase [Ignavibacteriaceae bacterium]